MKFTDKEKDILRYISEAFGPHSVPLILKLSLAEIMDLLYAKTEKARRDRARDIMKRLVGKLTELGIYVKYESSLGRNSSTFYTFRSDIKVLIAGMRARGELG